MATTLTISGAAGKVEITVNSSPGKTLIFPAVFVASAENEIVTIISNKDYYNLSWRRHFSEILINGVAPISGEDAASKINAFANSFKPSAATVNTPTLQEVTIQGNITTSTIIAALATLDNELATFGQVKQIAAETEIGAEKAIFANESERLSLGSNLEYKANYFYIAFQTDIQAIFLKNANTDPSIASNWSNFGQFTVVDENTLLVTYNNDTKTLKNAISDILLAIQATNNSLNSHVLDNDIHYTLAERDKLASFTAIFTTELKSSYDLAVTNSHTHANKAILDASTESFTTSLKNSYDSHISNINNPHLVTKAQVGLSNVDNTADATKNVLSATKLFTPRSINGVSFDGTSDITIPTGLAYGGIFMFSGNTPQSIPQGATFTKLIGFTNNGVSFGLNNSFSSNQITIQKSGVYKIEFTISCVTQKNGLVWTFNAFKTTGGVATKLDNIQGRQIWITSTNMNNLSFFGIVQLEVNDIIDVRCIHSDSSAQSISPNCMNLLVTQIS